MHKIIALNNNYVAAEMLPHDWVLQTYQTQVGQGRTRGSNAGTTEQHKTSGGRGPCAAAWPGHHSMISRESRLKVTVAECRLSNQRTRMDFKNTSAAWCGHGRACRPVLLLSGPLHTGTHASIRLPEDP